MIKKSTAMFLVFLIFSSMFAYAETPSKNNDKKDTNADDASNDNSNEDIGEDIIINIDEYQPKIIRSSLLEEQNVKVYALLNGIPSNPTINIDKITGLDISQSDVKIKTKPAGKKVSVGSITYIKPRGGTSGAGDLFSDQANGIIRQNYDLTNPGYTQDVNYNNLGTLVIPIKRIPKENDVPNQIDLEITGRIKLYVAEDLGHSKYNMVLPEVDESEWIRQKEQYSFYDGYLRAVDISKDEAAFNIYDKAGKKVNLIPIKIKEGSRESFYGWKKMYDDLRGLDDVFNKYYITLNEIRSRTKSVNAVIYRDNNDMEISTLQEGSRLYEGSNYIVESITESTDPDDAKRDVKIIKLENMKSGYIKSSSSEIIKFGEISGEKKDDGENDKASPEENEEDKTKRKNCDNIFNEAKKKIEDGVKKDIETYDAVDELTRWGTDEKNNDCIEYEKNDLSNFLTELRSYYSKFILDIDGSLGMLKIEEQSTKTDEEKQNNDEQIKTLNDKKKILEDKVKTIEDYMKNILKIETENEVFTPEGGILNGVDNPVQYVQQAIIAYQDVVNKYADSDDEKLRQIAENAQLNIGYMYMKLADEGKAISTFQAYLEKFGSDNAGAGEIQRQIEELKLILKYRSSAKRLNDAEGPITVYITGVNMPIGRSTGTAYLSIDNGPAKQIYIGSTIDQQKLGDYTVESIEDKGVLITSANENKKEFINSGSSESINIGNKNVNVKVSSASTMLEAVVTIEPIPEKAESSIKFNLHIPIEKRPFELPLFSDTIDKEINKTQKLIEKVEKLVNNVEKIHKVWTAGCYATFGIVTVKNLFSGGSKAVARQKIRDKWYDKYKKENPEGKKSFDSYLISNSNLYNDDLERADGIIKKIDSGDYLKELDKNDEYKKYKGTLGNSETLREWYLAKELAKQDTGYISKYIQEQASLQKELAEQETLKLFDDMNKGDKNFVETTLIENGFSGMTQADYLFNKEKLFDKIRQRNIKERIGNDIFESFNADSSKDNEINIDKWLRNHEEIQELLASKTPEEQNLIKNEIMQTLTGVKETNFGVVYAAPMIDNLDIISKNNNYFYDDPLTGAPYAICVKDAAAKEGVCGDKYKQFAISSNRKNDLEKYTGADKEKLYVMRYDGADGIPAVNPAQTYASINQIPVASTAKLVEVGISLGAQSLMHKPMLTRMPKGNRNEGLVKQLSIDSENYAEFKYSPDGRIEGVDVYRRANPNSGFVSGSEFRVGSLQDELKKASDSKNGLTAEYKSALNNVNNCASKLNSQMSKKSAFKKGDKIKCKELGTYAIDEAKNDLASGPSCTDYMDPSDCKLLFNACDPVVCPASRCNLGGNWDVENVVQTGLFGSIALCMLNFPEVVMPVCITGIDAGLQNVNSILKGYKQCLETQKIKGQSVGICDRVRNVYVCDMLWREGMAIFNVKGGLMSLITEKIFSADTGGDEYSSFGDSVDNSVNGMKYFTQSYAKNVFASYNGGSLDEIGTQICKAAIYGKVPGVGDFFSEIQKPESPPQFIAFFDSVPYQDISRVPTSLYSVYYHIYAGENEDVSYSVYLRSVDEAGSMLIKPQFIAQNRRLAKGQFADENIDKEFTAGYNEVCVDIKTQKYGRISECGFGKVTTDFGIDYLNDMYIAGQAKGKINSEKECVSDTGRLTDLSVGSSGVKGSSLQANAASAAIGSFSTGLTKTGLVRKCSGNDPDGISDEDKWRQVGNCGEDEKGRDLGFCYIYTDALAELIKDKERLDETKTAIGNLKGGLQNPNYGGIGELSEAQVDILFSSADSAQVQCETVSTPACGEGQQEEQIKCTRKYPLSCDEAIGLYQKAAVRSYDNFKKANAQFEIGDTYVMIYKRLTKVNDEDKDSAKPKKTSAETIDIAKEDAEPLATNNIKLGTLSNVDCPMDLKVDNSEWDSLINKYAKEYTINPIIIKCMISRESDFNKIAVSLKGAAGLMQLMPCTAKFDLKLKVPIESYNYDKEKKICKNNKDYCNSISRDNCDFAGTVDKRFNPEKNVDAGANYLSMMLELSKNDLGLALASYHAGFGNVEKSNGNIPNIPETQQYVACIQRCITNAKKNEDGAKTERDIIPKTDVNPENYYDGVSAKLYLLNLDSKGEDNGDNVLVGKKFHIVAQINKPCATPNNIFKIIYYTRDSKDAEYILDPGEEKEFKVYGIISNNYCFIEQSYDISFDQFASFEVYSCNIGYTMCTKIGKSREVKLMMEPKSVFKDAYLEKFIAEDKDGKTYIKLKPEDKLNPTDTVRMVIEFEKGCDKKDEFSLKLGEDDYLIQNAIYQIYALTLDDDCKLINDYTLQNNDFDFFGSSLFYIDVYDNNDLNKRIGTSITYSISKN